MYGWQSIDRDGTRAMIVPSGIVISRIDTQESSNGIAATEAMVYVPCTPDQAFEWIREHQSQMGV